MDKKLEPMLIMLRQPVYALITISTATGLGFLYYFLTLSLMPFSTVIETLGLPYLLSSIGLTITVAALAGVNVSLLLFKIRRSVLINIKRTGSSTAFGSTLAAFTPGCPACTTSLTTILSAVGGLAIFPLQGLELKIVSVAALIFSISSVIRQLHRARECKSK